MRERKSGRGPQLWKLTGISRCISLESSILTPKRAGFQISGNEEADELAKMTAGESRQGRKRVDQAIMYSARVHCKDLDLMWSLGRSSVQHAGERSKYAKTGVMCHGFKWFQLDNERQVQKHGCESTLHDKRDCGNSGLREYGVELGLTVRRSIVQVVGK